jgi:hypothetical protein
MGEWGALFEAGAEFDGAELLDVAEDAPVEDVRRRLRARFAGKRVDRVAVVAGGVVAGVATRATVAGSQHTSEAISLGDSDRASQAGESTGYRVLTFRCPACATMHYRTFYDPRELPTCQGAPGAGHPERKAELQP